MRADSYKRSFQDVNQSGMQVKIIIAVHSWVDILTLEAVARRGRFYLEADLFLSRHPNLLVIASVNFSSSPHCITDKLGHVQNED